MSIPLQTGAAADVRIGPIYATDGVTVKEDLAYNASGIDLSVYIGSTESTPTLSGTTDADWWFRAAAGGRGEYFLRVPASFLIDADDGKELSVSGEATGFLPFYSTSVYQITNPDTANDIATAAPFLANMAEDLDAIVTLSDPGVGIAILTSGVQTAAAAALTAYDPPTKAELDSAVSPLATSSALSTVSGKIDTIDTEVGVIDGVVDSILLDTAEIENLASLDSTAVQAAAAAALAAYDPPTKAEMDTGHGTLATAIGAIDITAEIDSEDIVTAVLEALDTILPDSLPADGVRATPRQALYMLLQHLTERGLVDDEMIIRKVDGTTELYALELDDAQTPTSVTRVR